MSRQTLSIRNKDDIWEHHLVPEEVYLYIMQLEGYINHPEVTTFLYRYPKRFKNAIEKIKKEK